MIDKHLEILANVHRRRMLKSLAESNPRPDLTVPPVDSDAGDEAQKQAVSMAHVHLPKLEAHGLVNWDRDDHTVTKGPQFDEIRPLLRSVIEHQNEFPSDEFPSDEITS